VSRISDAHKVAKSTAASWTTCPPAAGPAFASGDAISVPPASATRRRSIKASREAGRDRELMHMMLFAATAAGWLCSARECGARLDLGLQPVLITEHARVGEQHVGLGRQPRGARSRSRTTRQYRQEHQAGAASVDGKDVLHGVHAVCRVVESGSSAK